MFQRQQKFQNTGNAGGPGGMADIRLDGAERAELALIRVVAERACECRALDGVAQHASGGMSLNDLNGGWVDFEAVIDRALQPFLGQAIRSDEPVRPAILIDAASGDDA